MRPPLSRAGLRMGAVAFPFDPAYAGRELGQALRVTGAKVCVIPDEYNGVDVAARLVEVAADIETHRVVVGNAERIGAIDFDEFFVQTPWEQRHDLSAVSPRDPDE